MYSKQSVRIPVKVVVAKTRASVRITRTVRVIQQRTMVRRGPSVPAARFARERPRTADT